jgi:imidazolonepropionase-like amidohydrolase
MTFKPFDTFHIMKKTLKQRTGHIYLAALLLCLFGLQARSETILLKGATIHTITRGNLDQGDVLIRDGKIALVAESIDTVADRIVNLAGKHIYPGMVATTTTLGLLEINAVRATLDTDEVGQWTPEILSWRAVNPESELIPVARANGITHAQPIPLGGTVSGQSGVIQLSGWTVEDLMVKPTVALHVWWPSMSLNDRPKELSNNPSNWKSPKDQAKQRKQRVREIAEFFESAKAYVSHREQNEEAHKIPNWASTTSWAKGKTPLFIHADEKRQIASAVQWADENDYKMVLVGGRDAWRLADMLSEHRIPVIYDKTFTLPSRGEDSYDAHYSAPSILAEAGVKVIFSEGISRFAASSIRNLPHSAAQAVAFGMRKEEALKGITLYPAQILGMGDRLGSIESGKEASLIALTGELLDIRSQVTEMWIQGERVSLESRHTRLYNKYRNRPKN